MRTALATVRTPVAVVLAALALALVPATGHAVGDVPQEMVDPAAAMEPEIELPTPPPAQEDAAEVVVTGVQTPDVVATGGAAVDRDGAVDASALGNVTYTAPSGVGTLPFTGIDGEQLVWLFLVGSLALCAGALAFGWAQAARQLA